MRIFVLTATYELRVSRKSHLRDHPTVDVPEILAVATTLLLTSRLLFVLPMFLASLLLPVYLLLAPLLFLAFLLLLSISTSFGDPAFVDIP
jgi:hypothetical protein